MKKILITLSLILVMLSCVAVLSACKNEPAESKLPPSVGLEFILNEDGQSYTFAGLGSCTDTQIVIPSSYEGLPVTNISGRALVRNDTVTSVVIPSSVTKIDMTAFGACSALTSVSIPDSVTEIGDWSFGNCPNLQYTEYGGAYYLGNSENEYVALIKVESDSIKVHKNTSAIMVSALRENDSNIFVEVDKGNKHFKAIDGTLYSEDLSRLIKYYSGSNATDFTVPNGVREICNYAFDSSNNLEQITVSDTVIHIGYGAFTRCDNLKSVTIPASVEYVGDGYNLFCPSFTDVYYAGTKAQWESIDWSDPETLLGSTTPPYIIHCSDGEIRRFFFD